MSRLCVSTDTDPRLADEDASGTADAWCRRMLFVPVLDVAATAVPAPAELPDAALERAIAAGLGDPSVPPCEKPCTDVVTRRDKLGTLVVETHRATTAYGDVYALLVSEKSGDGWWSAGLLTSMSGTCGMGGKCHVQAIDHLSLAREADVLWIDVTIAVWRGTEVPEPRTTPDVTREVVFGCQLARLPRCAAVTAGGVFAGGTATRHGDRIDVKVLGETTTERVSF